MKVKKHISIWYSLDIEIDERKNLFDTLSQWGIISQVNVFTYVKMRLSKLMNNQIWRNK